MKPRIDVWSYVEKTDSCWIWIGPTNPKGYGAFRGTLAHRYIYELVKGSVSLDLVLDHIVCDNKICVNPDHLKPVTSAENTLRGNGTAAQNARKTHCWRGHLLEGENVRIEMGKYGKVRRCLLCKKLGRQVCRRNYTT
jgi:hypothetical protein